ncbi:phosphate ABC transporter substrate-binding protein PstS [Xylanimonas oleitrophica]|uniref:phosphate ABC transporter substrate-binding protein PstS n=1 Tax=Xylanimonas oleitrophica TaxID=2607479 RepID=UPI001FE41BAC|nr:phosphate ABC transporter substrate-binding protein PstS [Xylanimonas oleitrophica]
MKLSRISRAGSVALVGALALTLAACGSDNPTGDAPENTGAPAAESPAGDISGTFSGAGASSQESAMGAWIAGFQSQNPDVSVSYDAAGSGAGREQFLAGGVSFAGSDAALKDEELQSSTEVCGPDGAIDLPLYISPIAVAFNLPGISSLNLAPETIANIFAGNITSWNDPAIAADNPDVNLPDMAITPVHRSDDSGTTDNFTEYLHATAGDVWTWEPDGVFPVEGGDSAQGTSGVVGIVNDTEGAVTYADASRVGQLGTAAIKVGEEWVPVSPEAAAAAVDASHEVEGRHEHDLAFELDRTTTAAGAYPLVLISYSLACLNYADEAEGNFVKAFLGYIASSEGQQAAASAAGSAPISDDLRSQVEQAIDAITVG